MKISNPFHDGRIEGVYVIHVRHFTDRAAHIRTQLARFNIPFEFIEPFDADQIDAATRQEFVARQLEVSSNAMSCSLKHMEALRRITARDQKMALVLEDDVILHPRFLEHLSDFLDEAKKISAPFSIQIGSGGNMFLPGKQQRPGQKLYLMPHVRATDSYLTGAAAARLRLDWMARHKIALPPDHLFNRSDVEMKIPIYWSHPTIVDQGSMNGMFHSAIDEGRATRARWILRASFLWQRLRRKYIYRWFR